MHDDFQLLLVDDSHTDARIIARALAEGAFPHRLTVVSNGRDAMEALNAVGESTARLPRIPDLILLDLNLPGLDGEEVLRLLKADPFLRVIPIVVLTTSRREVDVFRSYAAGANTFIPKPSEYSEYRDLVRLLLSYWKNAALLPILQRPSQKKADRDNLSRSAE